MTMKKEEDDYCVYASSRSYGAWVPPHQTLL
jgi:hypothetical protein